jgi:hypothetical protein
MSNKITRFLNKCELYPVKSANTCKISFKYSILKTNSFTPALKCKSYYPKKAPPLRRGLLKLFVPEIR